VLRRRRPPAAHAALTDDGRVARSAGFARGLIVPPSQPTTATASIPAHGWGAFHFHFPTRLPSAPPPAIFRADARTRTGDPFITSSEREVRRGSARVESPETAEVRCLCLSAELPANLAPVMLLRNAAESLGGADGASVARSEALNRHDRHALASPGARDDDLPVARFAMNSHVDRRDDVAPLGDERSRLGEARCATVAPQSTPIESGYRPL
jgi:hypothetical protein